MSQFLKILSPKWFGYKLSFTDKKTPNLTYNRLIFENFLPFLRGPIRGGEWKRRGAADYHLLKYYMLLWLFVPLFAIDNYRGPKLALLQLSNKPISFAGQLSKTS